MMNGCNTNGDIIRTYIIDDYGDNFPFSCSTGTMWHIPSGTTIGVCPNHQYFIYGDMLIEGELQLSGNSQLVVLNGNIYLSGGTITGTGNAYNIFLPLTDTKISNLTYSGNVLTIYQTDGSTFSATINSSTPFTGNTSGDCITDLYVSNLNSCSPLHIQNISSGDVLIGENGGVNVGIGNPNPTSKLDVIGDLSISGTSILNGILNVIGSTSPQYVTLFKGVNGTGSNFAIGVGDETFGVANDILNSGLTAYNKYNLTASEINLNIVGNNNVPQALSIDSNGDTTINQNLTINDKTKTTNFQMTSGATNGYVLTSDVSGNAYWSVPFSGSSVDTYVTGFTYDSSNVLTISQNQGQPDLTVTLPPYITGFTDYYVTGGTYSNGTLTLERQDSSFTISGFLTGTTDTYVTGFTYLNNNLIISQNDGQPDLVVNISSMTGLTIDGSFSATTYLGLPIDPDNYITGGTYSNGTLTLDRQNGSVSISGFLSADTYVTGFTFNNSNYDLTISQNNGLPSLTQNLGILASDVNVTGGTYNPNNGIATFYNNAGGSFQVSGFLTGFTDIYVTSGTYNPNNGNLTLTRTDSVNVVVTGFTDYYVTGGTYSNGTLTLNRQNGSVSISGLKFTGNTSGDCITDLYVTNLNSCSPLHIQPTSSGNVLVGENGGVNVGIGTSTPSEKLEVNGNIKSSQGVIVDGGTYNGIRFNGSGFSRISILNSYKFDGVFTEGFKFHNYSYDFLNYDQSGLNGDNFQIANSFIKGKNAGISDTSKYFAINVTGTPTSMLHVLGSDSSFGFGLKVQNSGGTNTLQVRNDGLVEFGDTSQPYYTWLQYTSGTLKLNYNTTSNFYWDGSQLQLTGLNGNGNSKLEFTSIAAKQQTLIRSYNNERLSFATNAGSANMQLSNGGNLYIGNDTVSGVDASARLEIRGSGTTSSGYGLKVQNSSGTDNFVVRNDGNVGIGTSTPSVKLEVKGSTIESGTNILKVTPVSGASSTVYNDSGQIVIKSDSQEQQLIVGSSTAAGYYGGIDIQGQSISLLKFTLAGSEIGRTWHAASDFNIRHSGTLQLRRHSDNYIYTNVNSTNGNWLFQIPTGAPITPYTNVRVGIIGENANSSTYGLKVQNSGGTDNFVVRNDGNVGIGTSSPSEKLEVSGKTKTTTLQVTSGATNGYILTSDSNGNAIWSPPSSLTGLSTTDYYVTGGTYSSGTLTLNRQNGSVTISGFLTGATDTLITGFTYSNNNLTINQNQGQSPLSVNISTMTGLTINGNLTATTITSTNLAGTGDRIVLASSQGTLSASTQTIIQTYIDPTGTVAGYLNNTSNWDIDGIYTGTTITGTYQGQKHYNSNYFFEAVDDNLWIRLIRG